MSFEQLREFVPTYVLVFFRLAGLTIFAPLFGSARIPKRVKFLLMLVLASAMCGMVKRPVVLPDTHWQLALGIAGELAFGLALGMIASFVFIAAQWSGEMIGQQMGFNISAVFDPAFGGGVSIIGDLYFMLTLVVFLMFHGHHRLILAIRASFDALPLLGVGVNESLLGVVVGFLQAATTLAVQLAAPMLVTMLVVDLALGCLSKTMPQLNVMTAGLTMRSGIGLVVLIFGIAITAEVLRGEIDLSLDNAETEASNPMNAVSALVPDASPFIGGMPRG